MRLYLHVDRRVPLDPFVAALSECPTGEIVQLPRRAIRWGGPAMVDATVDGLERAMQDGCDYVFLLSGQDFPLRPAGELVRFAEEAGSRSYVSHWELPTPRWRLGGRDRTDFYSFDVRGRRETCIPRGEDTSSLSLRGRLLNQVLRLRSANMPPRRTPAYVRAVGGWQWLNLSRPAVEYILSFLEQHPDYRRYHEHTLIPDELFFQTILLGAAYPGRHDIVDDALRFMLWRDGEPHPRVLTEADLPAMLASGNLFARKFDDAVDGRVLRYLAELGQ